MQLLAAQHRLAVRSPVSLRTPEAQAAFAELGADAAVVAAYGLILPRPILCAPRLGCLNVHASLLPRWRGAAPIQRALLAGDTETGITIMQMEEGLDTGPILLQQAVPIAARDDRRGSFGRACGAGRPADRWRRSTALPTARWCPGRSRKRASPMRAKSAARTAGSIGAAPRPLWSGRCGRSIPGRASISRARAIAAGASGSGCLPLSLCRVKSGRAPGTVLDDNLSIACGEGVLRPLRLQRPGRAPLDAADFLRGFPIAAGTVLPCPATS